MTDSPVPDTPPPGPAAMPIGDMLGGGTPGLAIPPVGLMLPTNGNRAARRHPR